MATAYLSHKGQAIQGEHSVPGDKSISHRALMLAAIAEGESTISGFLAGEDCLATLKALRQLGVRIEVNSETKYLVHGVGINGLKACHTPLDLGNSGTGLRLMAGLLAGQGFTSTLTGDGSLRRRPMARIIEPLSAMGAEIIADKGQYAPLVITGNANLNAIEYRLPIVSAQVKSAIMLAGLSAKGETVIQQPAQSRDHTERMLQTFGADVEVDDGLTVYLRGKQRLRATQLSVPGDISSAAFLMVAATIVPGSDLLLKGVGVNPTRTGIIDILRAMGADIELSRLRQFGAEPVSDIRVRSAKLIGIEIGAELVPNAIDEFPAILIAAAVAQGRTHLSGAHELRVKESDRLAVMATGLRKLGVVVEEFADGVSIQGVERLQGGDVDSLGDHRIAMAFSVAGQVAQSAIKIHDCDNVATSFPGFVGLADKVGMGLETSG